MPKYTAKLTVPTTATNLDPITADLKVSQGIISQVTVIWTPGSEWVNCLRVLYEGGQIIPSEGGGFCRGDGYPDVWPEYIVLDKSHPTLNIEAWNEDNEYDQECLISIIVLPVIDTMGPITAILKKLLQRLGLA